VPQPNRLFFIIFLWQKAFNRLNQPDHRELESNCNACPYGVEYRFSVLEASFEEHESRAKTEGCFLASIKSPEEQAAALKAMQPFIGYPYTDGSNFQASFAYIGAKVIEYLSDSVTGRYVFEWVDGSGQFTATRGSDTATPYTNFIDSDPNGRTAGYEDGEPYLALSLDENGSKGITRGDWIDFSARKSPALYKCCAKPANDFAKCTVK
jgi:hypothetical protein